MMRRFRQFPTIGGRRGDIPADCVEVQYLESTGTQYIDTGFVPNRIDAFMRIDVSFTQYSGDGVFGCWQQTGDLFFVDGYNQKFYPRYCGNQQSIDSSNGWNPFALNSIEYADGKVVLNGETKYDGISTATLAGAIRSFYIFAQNSRGNAINFAYARCYSLELGFGSETFLDLVPVRRVENGVSVGYMCDRLTGELYGNQGTGAFVVGPDKGAWTNPYVTDGLVAMWDGEWNAGGGVHDDQLRLVDLSGNCHDMTFVGDCTLGSNCVTIPGKSGAYGTVTGLEFGTPSSQELVTAITDYTPYGRFVGENRGIVGLGGRDTGRLYGWGKDAIIADVYYNYGQIFAQSLSVGNSDAEYYFNGSSRGSISITATQYSGQTTFFNRTSGGRGLDGNLYNVRFYNRALTASEIAANYAVDRERFGLS